MMLLAMLFHYVFSMEDLKNVLTNTRSGKAPGKDDLATKLVKYAPVEVHNKFIATGLATKGKYWKISQKRWWFQSTRKAT